MVSLWLVEVFGLVLAHITITCYVRVLIVVMTEPSQSESNQNVVMMIKIKDLK